MSLNCSSHERVGPGHEVRVNLSEEYTADFTACVPRSRHTCTGPHMQPLKLA